MGRQYLELLTILDNCDINVSEWMLYPRHVQHNPMEVLMKSIQKLVAFATLLVSAASASVAFAQTKGFDNPLFTESVVNGVRQLHAFGKDFEVLSGSVGSVNDSPRTLVACMIMKGDGLSQQGVDTYVFDYVSSNGNVVTYQISNLKKGKGEAFIFSC